MRELNPLWLMPILLLSACSAVKNPIEHQYKLTAFSTTKIAQTPSSATLLITPTEAASGYQTEEMHYSLKPYSLRNFAKNSWFSPPANMFYPLLIQSIQNSGFFHAVSSGSYISKTDFRLDTQLIEIQQNFVTKPSVLELKMKAVLSRVDDNTLLASHTFNQHIVCPQESPYGGVIAANRATQKLTKEMTRFVITIINSQKKTR